MKLRTLATSIALAGLLFSPALAAVPSRAMMATIGGVLAAGNADNGSKVNSFCATTSVVVDDFAPYAWSGHNACASWWNALDRANAATHTTNVRVTAQRITQFSTTGNAAYVVVPLAITYRVKGKLGHQTGLWVLTLHRVGGTWKITTASWATATTSM